MPEPQIAVIGLKGLPAFGGAAAVGETLVNRMRNDFQFTVYSVSSHTGMETGTVDGVRHVVFRKFPVRFLNTFYYYLASSLHALFFGKFDLVHLHHIDAGFAVPLLRCRYKVVTTSHGRPQFNDKWSSAVRFYFSMMEKLALKYSSHMVSVSSVVKKEYEKLGYKDMAYIPNGVDPLSVRDVPKIYDISFSAGRIIPLKGCDVLLRSLMLLAPKPKSVIIGDCHDPAYFEYLSGLAKDMPVTFTGLLKNRQELFQTLSSSKIFVFPSRSEAMSMMLLEVAALKVPIVCSDIEANRAVFRDDEVFFFKNGDEKDLADKITCALDSGHDMVNRSEKARSNALTRYSWDSIAEQYSQLYNKVLHA